MSPACPSPGSWAEDEGTGRLVARLEKQRRPEAASSPDTAPLACTFPQPWDGLSGPLLPHLPAAVTWEGTRWPGREVLLEQRVIDNEDLMNTQESPVQLERLTVGTWAHKHSDKEVL